MYLAYRSPRRSGTGSTMGPTARTMRSTTSSRARIRRQPCTILGAMCLTGRWRRSVRLQMGTKSALVSAGLYFLCSIDVRTDYHPCVVADTWSHNYSEFLRRSVVVHDGFHLLMPVRSDGVQEPRRVCGVVVHCECLFRLCAVDAACANICPSPRLRPSSSSPGLP